MSQQPFMVNQITELLKNEFNPSKLYLFGSQSQGTARGESDYDFVMILPVFKGDRMEMWEKCHELIFKKLGVSADIFTYSQKQFDLIKGEFSSIPETAINTGREIDLGIT